MKYLLSILVLIFVATSCKKEEVKTYIIGEEAFGGIVIQLDETNQHGLVVAKTGSLS